eukprot:CAMPEP_0184864204 /NCGR_PEP_ID=MMETSP0580-20130426/14089_1 /TAXON_ID=1118495 /ORGANISM="Dactyliosolen fragilissimus" /LENGTH=880 /DNA_ID=CAMNT_0027362891 /DNA_START=49 /DNA_END=2688 /DNA_ORIENTATION=+
MDVQERNATRTYSLSTGPAIPEWLGERARRNLSKRDSAIRRRIELLQDLSFPDSSTRLKCSPDGRYLLACGTYHPRIRCYELSELSMKFERYCDAELIDLEYVGEDYGRFCTLTNDRTISFHAPYGLHHTIRIPTFGREMVYERSTCRLLVACGSRVGRNGIVAPIVGKNGSRKQSHDTNAGGNGGGGGCVYRINLEEGRFDEPLRFGAQEVIGGSCVTVSPTHSLLALGGEDGIARFWDTRLSNDSSISPFSALDVKSSTAGYGFYDSNYSAHGGGINPNHITSLAFDHTGLYFGAGTGGGNVALYDIRSSKPLHIKEHQYGLPIHTLRFHSQSGTILSADSKLIKAWRYRPNSNNTSDITANHTNNIITPHASSLSKPSSSSSSSSTTNSNLGSILVNIEGSANINHFVVMGDESDPTGNSSGLILCAGEQPKIQSFYCPALGAAPRWCSFLDNITEELEERDHGESSTNSTTNATAANNNNNPTGNATIYEDYKFVTQSEIESLGIQKLIGTPLLRGYMHGFFIDIGLYNRIKAVANPFEYEEYRKKKIKEKMDEKFASRIAPKKQQQQQQQHQATAKKAKVNVELANRLEQKSNTNKKDKATILARNVLADERFGSLFENPDFAIDEEDINFKLRNPSGVPANSNHHVSKKEDMDSDAEDDDISDAIHTGDEENISHEDDAEEDFDTDSDSNSDDNDDGFRGAKIRGENYDEVKAVMTGNSRNKSKKNSVNGESFQDYENKKKAKKVIKKKKKNIMIEADEFDGDDAIRVGLGSAGSSSEHELQRMKRRKEMSMTLEERVRQRNGGKLTSSGGLLLGNAKTLKSLGEGAVKEVKYIPKDTQRKMEERNKQKYDGDTQDDGNSKRKRRGIKELGFKT